MAASTWESRELRILEAVARLEPEHEVIHSSEIVASGAGLEDRETYLGLIALIDGDYVAGTPLENGDLVVAIRLLPEGRRAIGQWPGRDTYVTFLEALDDAIANAGPDEKGRLARLRDAVVGVGRDVFVSVVSTVISTGKVPGQ
jgi:hypothetical protein